MSHAHRNAHDPVADYCRFSFEPAPDGRLAATCVACGRRVTVRSQRARAACRASPRYAAVHARLIGNLAPSPDSHVGSGPGTELSKLLGRFGITASPTCSCRAMAGKMDAWGPDECERPERIEEVLAVMRSEAHRRGLPFVDAVGRLLIKKAIRNARKRLPTPCV